MQEKVTESQKIAEDANLTADELRGDKTLPTPPIPSKSTAPPVNHYYSTVNYPPQETDVWIVLAGIAMAIGFLWIGVCVGIIHGQ